MERLLDRKYFKMFFIFYVFINTLSLGYFGIERNPLYIIVFIWGIAILGFDLFKGRLFYKNSHLGIIGLYAVILLLSTYFNKEYSNTDSFIIWGMQFLIFFLMFGNSKNTNLTMIKDEIRLIIPMTTILTLCASGISLLMFFMNVSLVNNGSYLGLVGDRLFGVYFNCNPASFLACMMMVFSLIAVKSKYKFRSMYLINFGIQFLYIILTGCRAAIIIVALIIIAILYYKVFAKQVYSRFKQIILSFILCVIVIFGSAITQKVLYVIPQMQGATVTENTGRFQLDKIFEIMNLVQEGKSSNIHKIYDLMNEVSSGRIELLNTAYKVLQTNPIQGIGINNFQRMGMVISPDDHVVAQKQVVHTHNVFVETMVVGGIFGFLVFFLFFLKSCATIWEVFKKYSGSSSYFIILCFMLIVLSDFIGGMLDYGVFYVYSLSSTLSWVFLGYLYWFNDHSKLRISSNSKYYDFMYYNLSKIDYSRNAQEVCSDVKVNILNALKSKDAYVIRMDIELIFMDKSAHFIYDVFFKILEDDDKVINNYYKEMALELYEMVNEEISVLVSDGNGIMELPKINEIKISVSNIT